MTCIETVYTLHRDNMPKSRKDDIPIQGPKDDNASQLVSITEEVEGDIGNIGNRNTATRGSKESAKMPKVPFSGFKKTKDKERDGKLITNKCGISFDINKDVQQRILNKKEKFVNRAAVQSSSDFSDALESVSPTSILKRKSSYIDMNNSTNTIVTESFQSCSTFESRPNGISDEKLLKDLTDGKETIESKSDIIGAQRTSIAVELVAHNNIQISQV